LVFAADVFVTTYPDDTNILILDASSKGAIANSELVYNGILLWSDNNSNKAVLEEIHTTYRKTNYTKLIANQ